MSKASRSITPSDIVETIFIDGLAPLSFDASDALTDYLTDFCVDVKGRIRLGSGFISMNVDRDDDMSILPSKRYEIKTAPWNSHADYVEIELPNPAEDFEYYTMIRSAFIAEIEKRLAVDLRNWRNLNAA